MSTDESAELRTLQARVFGRDGTATDADRARLDELMGRSVPMPPVLEPVPASEEVMVVAPVETPADAEAAEPSEDSAFGASVTLAAPHRPLFARGPVLAGIGLLAGFALGWLSFGWDTAGFLLNLENAETRAELEASGDYDPGSVVAVGAQYGAVGWLATADDGALECAIATAGDRVTEQCLHADEIDDIDGQGYLGGSVFVPSEDGAELNVAFWMAPGLGGERVALFQKWDTQTYDWTDQFTDDEVASAITISAAFDLDPQELQLIGYDGDSPVWAAWGNLGYCVMADGDDGAFQACSDMEDGGDIVLEQTVNGVRTEYTVSRYSTGNPVLTITRVQDATEYFLDPDESTPIDETTAEIAG